MKYLACLLLVTSTAFAVDPPFVTHNCLVDGGGKPTGCRDAALVDGLQIYLRDAKLFKVTWPGTSDSDRQVYMTLIHEDDFWVYWWTQIAIFKNPNWLTTWPIDDLSPFRGDCTLRVEIYFFDGGYERFDYAVTVNDGAAPMAMRRPLPARGSLINARSALVPPSFVPKLPCDDAAAFDDLFLIADKKGAANGGKVAHARHLRITAPKEEDTVTLNNRQFSVTFHDCEYTHFFIGHATVINKDGSLYKKDTATFLAGQSGQKLPKRTYDPNYPMPNGKPKKPDLTLEFSADDLSKLPDSFYVHLLVHESAPGSPAMAKRKFNVKK
ncbi:MAG: hypothetical protein ACJ8F7_19290 [Gemmataceae bacterium]